MRSARADSMRKRLAAFARFDERGIGGPDGSDRTIKQGRRESRRADRRWLAWAVITTARPSIAINPRNERWLNLVAVLAKNHAAGRYSARQHLS